MSRLVFAVEWRYGRSIGDNKMSQFRREIGERILSGLSMVVGSRGSLKGYCYIY